MTRDKAILVLNSLSTWLGYERPITEEIVEAIKTISKPYFPSNIDEAANRQAALEQPYKWEEQQDGSFGVTPLFVMSNIRSAFKAGAEWMAGQGVKAHCVESCNPVSYSEDENLHLITLVYAENENTPYVLGGDEIEIILRKKQ